MAEKGLAAQPEQDGAVLSDGPQHTQVLEVCVGLSQYIDTLVFELVEMVAHCFIPSA